MTGWSVPGYTYLRELVHDVSGQLVLARHDETGDAVAIRYLRGAQGDRDSAARSAAQLAGLDDPHVVAPRECVESEHGVAVVRDLVDGVALRALLVEEGAVGPEAALVVLADVLRGLAAAHGRGVPHGDCRPGTVLVTRDGGAVLVEAGIARGDDRELMAAATPFYLAPEQWGGAGPDPQADLYAAAATFFECIMGAPPYFATDPARLRARHETAALPVAVIPGPLRDLIGHGLAKRPQDRPATAAQFLAQAELAAVGGFGEQWESRGRAELSRLATGPQPPFSLDAATVPAPGEASPAAPRTPLRNRLGRTLVGATVAAVFAVGLVTVLPTDTPADERGNSSGYIQFVPSPLDPALAPSRPSSPPAQPASEAPPLAPLAAENGEQRVPQPAATPDPARTPAGVDAGLDAGIELPIPSATPRVAAARITGLSIDSFSRHGDGTRLVVRVDTSGTGPVQLFLGYGAGGQAVGATSLDMVTRKLSGATSYDIVDEREFGEGCLDYWVVLVHTGPAGGDVRDSAELTGQPCGSTG